MLPAAISTSRLRLRPWNDADLAPFAAMSADPRVMRHMPAVLGPEESGAFVNGVLDRAASDVGRVDHDR